jgi:hypothetical protein
VKAPSEGTTLVKARIDSMYIRQCAMPKIDKQWPLPQDELVSTTIAVTRSEIKNLIAKAILADQFELAKSLIDARELALEDR